MLFYINYIDFSKFLASFKWDILKSTEDNEPHETKIFQFCDISCLFLLILFIYLIIKNNGFKINNYYKHLLITLYYKLIVKNFLFFLSFFFLFCINLFYIISFTLRTMIIVTLTLAFLSFFRCFYFMTWKSKMSWREMSWKGSKITMEVVQSFLVEDHVFPLQLHFTSS